jgi:hypothetical protein
MRSKGSKKKQLHQSPIGISPVKSVKEETWMMTPERIQLSKELQLLKGTLKNRQRDKQYDRISICSISVISK